MSILGKLKSYVPLFNNSLKNKDDEPEDYIVAKIKFLEDLLIFLNLDIFINDNVGSCHV